VSLSEYKNLLEENPIVADISAFPGPHINHLTPRTLDIDEVQAQMEKHHIQMKEIIEGPPARSCPILLRQTSFKALKEGVYFPLQQEGTSSDQEMVLGSHTARFGEIEQRGAALTQKGRDLYDHLVHEAWKKGVTPQDPEAYKELFKLFPDTWEEIRRGGLAWFRYYVQPEYSDNNRASSEPSDELSDVEGLIRKGKVGFEPLVYEDFLPLSAAGIFRSNLSIATGWEIGSVETESTALGREYLQKATKMDIADEFQTYERLQDESLEICRKHFGISS
jgi:uncharacterized glyoxalase superfamily metalloenzyme YdcJ